ncbi:polyketide synthase [Chaetomium fimeti]|uniref:Polyketide synthase n=1 Tax=Chaetomium fimeti TaxID=1854472 RepID=A0AAE0H8J9_9PEZI|nr:polyketide synthase [Chaetomium fimeti]
MAHSTAFMPPKVLIFGSQILSFDAGSGRKLRDRVVNDPALAWAPSVIRELPGLWKVISESLPSLRALPGEALLKCLEEWMGTGVIPETAYPLPNVVLTPLVVLFHLAQYSRMFSSSNPAFDLYDIPLFTSTEFLGLCTGILGAAAAAASSRREDLQHFSPIAVRLAMVIGAIVDAKDRSEGEARSISVGWSTPPLGDRINEILTRYPGAYVSVWQDETRATVTCPGKETSALKSDLLEAGVSIADVSLQGRFHYQGHLDDVQLVEALCDKYPWFQLPDASQLAFPLRSNAGDFITTGKLHHHIVRSMLAVEADWATAFARVQRTVLENGLCQVLGFGPESCAPASLVRKLGSQFTHLTALDVARTALFTKVSGLDGPPDYRSRVVENGIAVVGMACHMPGAADMDEFWSILRDGRSQHIEVPPERFGFETAWRDGEGSRKWYGNFVKDHDAFDHKFFKKSPREMSSTDPQHRLMLQVAYQAVEQSGYFNRLQDDVDKHIGCYIGVGLVDYERNIACAPANAYSATGNLKSFAAGKISHHFGWTGPGLTVDTACSSSAVAVHMACRAILSGECTGGALAGGVNVMTSPEWFQNLAGASFLSPTGQCKPFDAAGDGYCRAEGVGAVFLKKLSSAIADGDHIHGVIAASTVYQNQSCTPITVPNAPSLADLFSHTVADAGLRPSDITYIEAHGTGTPVGDPAEYAGIRKVLGGPSRSQTVSLGSVKGLVGHTESASGIAALLKTLVMLNKGAIPPQASFRTINPAIEAAPDDNIDIATTPRPWDADFRAALINNYGASGSNACLVVTQGHRAGGNIKAPAGVGLKYPFWLCANDDKSLRAYCARLRRLVASVHQHEVEEADRGIAEAYMLANLSFQVSRQSNRSLPSSLTFCSTSLGDLQGKLAGLEMHPSQTIPGSVHSTQPAVKPAVILCFGGQNSTSVAVDRVLYDHVTVFRQHLDRCDAVCRSLGLESLYPVIFQRTPAKDVVKLQTMLFASQYACAMSWLSCGLQPSAVVGFSFGELTALCVAGALSLEAALGMVSGRARVIEVKWGRDSGAMLAIEAEQEQIEKLLRVAAARSDDEGASIACFNGPTSFTLAGSTNAIDSVAETLSGNPEFAGIRNKRIDVTNAFHSSLVEPLVEDLEGVGAVLRFKPPAIPIEHATEFELPSKELGAKYVADHMRKPVYFSHAVRRIAEKYQDRVWLEAGFNSTITSIASRAVTPLKKGSHKFQAFNTATDNNSSLDLLVDATLHLWNWGLNVLYWPHHASQRAQYLPMFLPPYQFEKSRHWMELKVATKPNMLANGNHQTTAVAQQQQRQLGLWSPVDSQTSNGSCRHARFLVHTASAEFDEHVRAHVIAQTAPLCPSTLQLHIAVDALMSIQPDGHGASRQPRLRGMTSHTPLSLGGTEPVWLDAESLDAESRIWAWKMSSAETVYVSGTLVFSAPDDPDWRDDFSRYERLVGWDRCQRLLSDVDPDEVVKGPKIYSRFADIVQYGDMYKGVAKIVGKGTESAGRVVADITTRSNSSHKSWLHTGLADSFCQVAGIFVNTMTDKLASEIYISDRIDQWLRSPDGLQAPDGDGSVRPETWEVLALHHRRSEKEYLSDVFIYDPRTGRLAEVILGIHYRKIPKAALAKALAKFAISSAADPVRQLSSAERAIGETTVTNGHYHQGPLPLQSHQEPVNGVNQRERKQQKADSGISNRVRDIIVNLSGLEPEQIKADADLVELGIDSLMGMELAREIESAFKITLRNDELMALTDFKSLVSCVQKHASPSNQHEAPEEEEEHEEGTRPAAHSSTLTDGVNGINGTAHHHNGITQHNVDSAVHLPSDTVLDAFAECREATDDFIREWNMAGYVDNVMTKSTELCVAHIVDAFEQLGCRLRSAKPGEVLSGIQHLPRHKQFVEWMYELLEKEARLIDIGASGIMTRTAVSLPTKPAESLYRDLTSKYPEHRYDHELTYLVGGKLADCLSGKLDGLHLIFGTPQGREIVSGMYSKSPINLVWVKQMEFFLRQLFGRLRHDEGTIHILEMGAGTGGTTAKMLPLLASLGLPVRYTVTDLSSSLVAAARKRFAKEYPFVQFRTVDIEQEPAADLLHSQHVVLATNCVHATHSLERSTSNIHKVLRSDGFLMMLEMTLPVPWVDLTFGLIEGWWLFDDGRRHALAPPNVWEATLRSVGYGHVSWTDGQLPESEVQRIIIALASGPRYDRSHKLPPSSTSAAQLDKPSSQHEHHDSVADMVKRQAVIDAYVEQYTRGFEQFLVPGPEEEREQDDEHQGVEDREHEGSVVLVTGATGSLGSHVVSHLASLPSVKEVVCLNRRSIANDPTTRQYDSLRSRGIALSEEALANLRVMETDASKPMLGLSATEHDRLRKTVTHILHNAWPMSITRGVEAFSPQFQTMQNLLALAAAATVRSKRRIGFQFISSIATVGCYPLSPDAGGVTRVPEERMNLRAVLPTGYGDAKLVCERMLDTTLHRHHPERFRPMVVRIAQIAGSTASGYWNPVEHFAFMVKSAQTLRSLPDLKGDLSWCPVNDVAAALSELLLSDHSPHPIYHIENPSRQSWEAMVRVLADALGIPLENIVPFEEWIRRVRRFPGSTDADNPAARLVDFLENHFVRMSCGSLVLDTANATEHSPTLQQRGPVTPDLVRKYVNGWMGMGFLR